MMYPLSVLPVLGATIRKDGPLPPRSSQQQPESQTYRAAYSGNYSRNQTSSASSISTSTSLSYTSTNSAQHINRSTKAAPKRDDIDGPAIAKQAIYHDQWKRLGFIGKGSYGHVYRALHITTGCIFAVKEVDSTKIKRRTLIQALQDERETLKELEHPNIVRYLGFEENQEILNIFLEYVPGGTIRSCLQIYGKFKEEVTKSFTSQILQGLSYLHSRSIIHRDLKSENVLVEPRGVCKISDFGISKKALEVDRGRLYSNMKGTIAYMAPEVIDNKNKGYDSKIDVWSVGCIVFEMWTGKAPWDGSQDVLQIFKKLFKEKTVPPLPDDILLSTTAENFRQEFFHFDPEMRPSAVELLQHVYLKLPPQWAFPGVEEMGQGSNTGTGSSKKREDLCESIYSDIRATAAEFNISIANPSHAPSLAQTMYCDVSMDAQASSAPLISIIPPLKPRKQRNFLNLTTCAMTSPNTSNPTLPLDTGRRQVLMHNTVPDDTDGAPSQKMAPPDRSKRRLYIYHPPPLPEINGSSPYSHQLIAPISIKYNKPIDQTFSRRINFSKPVPAKLLTPSMDANSFGISMARPNQGKVDHSGQRGAPYIPPESEDDGCDDDHYSSSTWKRPPVDIQRRLSPDIRPVESVSKWNTPSIHLHRQPLPPSAILRPSVETVYKGFLSENVEDIDLSDTDRNAISSKRRYTMKSIREVVEARLSQAQITPAQSLNRTHFWNSHMEEV